uniref:Uncharacterized protein n=1 Tax=Anopheles maculatus TaxID=74869 RepID=A0A182T867_9DIPT
HVKTKEYRKIVVHAKIKKKPQPKLNAPSAAPNNVHAAAKSRLHGSSQCSVQITPVGNAAKQKAVEKPLAKFPWLPTGDSCNYIIDVRFFRLALFMRLDQSIVDEALAIIEKQQAIASMVATKSTPTNGSSSTPASSIVAATVRQQRTFSPGPTRRKRSGSDPTSEDDLQRELQQVKGQLKTILALLRRKEQQEKGKDKQLARDKAFKRRTKKRTRKGLKKAITEQQMGDQ